MGSDEGTAQVSLRLPRALLAKVDAIAKREDRTRTQVIERALELVLAMRDPSGASAPLELRALRASVHSVAGRLDELVRELRTAEDA